MNITVYEEIEQIRILISLLDEYCNTLNTRLITDPLAEIHEAINAGLPVEYADDYERRCCSHNVATAQNMINNIREFHIPYWQHIILELQKGPFA